MVTSAASGTRRIALPGYDVTVGAGILERLGDVVHDVAPAHRYAIVTDSNVGPTYAARVRDSLGVPPERVSVFSVPAGESHKTRETWSRVTDELFAAHFGRDCAMIALGGGVVGDLAGFVAATFMRGVPFVQVPTTLLAMIDASVGGKTGVDTPSGKNLVGAFHQPAAVVADLRSLATLPAAQLRAGMAEAIKHGVIADAGYVDGVSAVAARLDEIDVGGAEMLDLVARSIEIKADVVRRDERETGLRKILNFGHTIGHAVEHLSGYAVLHGEAVAIGMVVESRIAERLGVAKSGTASRVQSLVREAGLPDSLPTRMSAGQIITATHGDKKARAGRAEYALPARIGAMAGESDGWTVAVPDAIVREALA